MPVAQAGPLLSTARDPTGSSTESSGPLTFNQVLLDELRLLLPDHAGFAELRAERFENPASPELDEVPRAENLKQLYREIAGLPSERPLSALCLSGGGIRSATFNLGVLQALARLDLLSRFDYLSTVSGGGYIGGWLKSWIRRDGTARVCNELSSTEAEQPLKPEPRPVDRLREFSNYLTPRRGLLSGDTWAAIAIVVRNLLLNWTVVLPVLMAAVGLPQLYLLAVELRQRDRFETVVLGLALLFGIIASIGVHRLRHPPRAAGSSPSTVRRWAVTPLILATVLLSLGAAWLDRARIEAADLIVFVLLWCVVLPLFGWLLREPSWRLKQDSIWPVREGLAVVGSGLVGAGLLLWVALTAHDWLQQRPLLYAILAVPILLAIYLIARSLFVGFADSKRSEEPLDAAATTGAWEDADREWWARFSGYVVMIAVLWPIVAWLGLLGWHVLQDLVGRYALPMLSVTGLLSGAASALLGKGGGTSAGRGGDQPAGPAWQRYGLAVAAPVFCVIVLLALGRLNVALIRWLVEDPSLFSPPKQVLDPETVQVAGPEALGFLALLGSLLLLGYVMGRVVNVNRFSLHGLYRNRLIRAYLGASNPNRKPDPFTGFALNDNLRLADLWKAPAAPGDIDSRRPLLLVNTTLNRVRGERLAWQERKAESFSMSPFYCGNFHEGYRRTREYGSRQGGISLGTALTISGAAANPNMGYHSSPALTFLLTLLNGRLGAWLGNTNIHGEQWYQDTGPRSALRPLLSELLGLTDNTSHYVELSDGGHFDNLGLYEMVLRRCRLIVVSDAGRDPESSFEDLGNAIRKIRIDFGISVDFQTPIRILPRSEKDSGLSCAKGSIRYSEVDGTDPEQDGVLVYVKPTLRGAGPTMPYDVFSYSRAAEKFPHESTVDQWFDESQFESYRALGIHIIREITGGAGGATPIGLTEFSKAVGEYLLAHPTSFPSPKPSRPEEQKP